MNTEVEDEIEREPRWPAALALVAVGVLFTAMPEFISFAPSWLLMLVMIILELPALLAHQRGRHLVAWALGMAGSAVVTLFLVLSVVLLVIQAMHHTREAAQLLRSSALLWVCNVIIFGSWYWRLDAGGPLGREKTPGHDSGAFLFPQMTMDPRKLAAETDKLWSPSFIDYLFLAFNTSAAFSPTDVPILSRWAKVLVMIQASISLTLVAVLVGRAVNAL